jgi:mannose-1-phosphate guanylyltransferase
MDDGGGLWSVVLAGGEGARMRRVVSETYGVDIPKQYCSFRGKQPLIRQTISRALRLTPRERVVTVVSAEHRRWWEAELDDLPRNNVVVQPCNRGTACGVLLPLVQVLLRDPHAFVVLFPSDHYVEDEAVLTRIVKRAVRVARRSPDSIVLLGVRPDAPDHDYGWIEPTVTTYAGAHWVLSFVEKPVPEIARDLEARGALWNSLVTVAQGLTLLAAFKAAFPELVRRFGAAIVSGDPGGDEERLVSLYEGLPMLDLSRDLFESDSRSLRVLAVPPCGWTDLGTPERVARCLERSGTLFSGDEGVLPRDRDSTAPDLAKAVTAYIGRRVAPRQL